MVKVLMVLSNPFMVDPRVYKEAEQLIHIDALCRMPASGRGRENEDGR